MRGKFITVEGIEGVGKTTNIQYIKSWLDSKKLPYACTREPGGTPLAEELRELLLKPREEVVSELTELLMVFAARAQHLHQVIEPVLAEGAWVLCDRFTDATYAYQGGGRGMRTFIIEELELLVQGSLRPDLTLLLDVPPEVGLGRAGERSAPDRFEQEQMAFFQRVRDTYLELAEKDAERFRVVDASLELPAVQAQIGDALESFWNAQ